MICQAGNADARDGRGASRPDAWRMGLAYLMRFELLAARYVVLGPAHYATEISWLHDRKYFLPQRSVVLALAAVAIVAALIENASWFGFVMWVRSCSAP